MVVGIEQKVEALIFASAQSITLEEIHHIIQSVEVDETINFNAIEKAVLKIAKKYEDPQFAIALQRLNSGYLFLTKPDFYPLLNQLQFHRSKKKLSQAALETLSIIAYRQPITKLEVEQIRGVNCDYSIQRLLERSLIKIKGKSSGLGRPLLYGISEDFMDYFGINSSADLPKLKDIVSDGNTIGLSDD